MLTPQIESDLLFLMMYRYFMVLDLKKT